MIKEEFEKLINDNKDLNKLLNEKEIIGFSDFSKLNFNTPDFRDYIEERYLDSFQVIYKKYSTKETYNNAKINALLRSLEYLGNPNIIKAVETTLNDTLNKSLNFLKDSKTIADEDIEKLNLKELLNSINMTVINIFNKTKSSELINNTKDQIIAHLLYISHQLKDVSPKYQRALYDTNEEILEKLKKINGYNPYQKSKYIGYSNSESPKTTDKSNEDKPILEVKKDKKYWIYIVIGILILMLKFCARI
ncbi:hypothetical protein [Tenacibaculum singaporense]|uniref:hypothetical protein n=1 Tax=Tenacibaculum singaporense TaxID=2358479 RepID=UPI000F67FCEE|nr:hypothetical protein [Tenacibaculum singaporense]RSC93957.1 hypothetical protein EI424_08100 [Tenacibaculum singaporense]